MIQQANTKTVITLEPQKVLIETIKMNGVKSLKETNFENLANAFTSEKSLETPLLPSQWGVIKYYRKNNYEGYVVTTPATIRKVKFDTGRRIGSGINSEGEYELPIPPLLWLFEVQKDEERDRKFLSHSMVYAIKHEVLTMTMPLYHAPFPNIGVSHGICWGNDMPVVPTSKSLQNLPARFFAQNFNSDLSDGRVECEIDGVDMTNALDHMGYLINSYREPDNDFSYPYETLKPLPNFTIENAVKHYLPGLTQ